MPTLGPFIVIAIRPYHPWLVVATMMLSAGCVGGRVGMRVPLSPGAPSGGYGGAYAHLVIPVEDMESANNTPFSLFGGELAATGELGGDPLRDGGVYSVSGLGISGEWMVVTRDALWMPTVQLGISWGEGIAVEAAGCYGGYAVELQGFMCSRASSAGWLGVDANIGTNFITFLGMLLSGD